MKKLLFIFLYIGIVASCINEQAIISPEDNEDNSTIGYLQIYIENPEINTRSGWTYDSYFPSGHIYSEDSKQERWMHNICLAYFDKDFLLEHFIIYTNYQSDGSPQNAIDNYENKTIGDDPAEYYAFTLGIGNVPLTTGAHYFYILCNLSTDYLNEISTFCQARVKELTKDEFEKKMLNQTIEEVAAPIKDRSGNLQQRSMMTNVISPVPHYMADKSLIVSGGYYPTINGISMEIGKSFAKVSLAYISSGTSRLENVQYRIVNDPKNMYMLPNIFKGQVHTPYYEEKITDENFDNYFANFFNPESHISFEKPEEDNSYSWRPASDNNNKTFAYCLENGNKRPLQGNSTMVLVKAKYIPEIWLNPDGTPGTASNDGTFWRIKSVSGYLSGYYNSVPALGSTQEAVKYEGGITYYPIWLETDNKYQVKRNHYYKIAVTEVLSAGANNLQSVMDPTSPLESEDLTNTRSGVPGNNLPEAARSIRWEQNN